MYNEKIAEYDRAYAGLANPLKIDYLSIFQEHLLNPRYKASLVAADKVHPYNHGYALITESVSNWAAWRTLFRQ
jgi:lysophospholipase L1-like esterase